MEEKLSPTDRLAVRRYLEGASTRSKPRKEKQYPTDRLANLRQPEGASTRPKPNLHDPSTPILETKISA